MRPLAIALFAAVCIAQSMPPLPLPATYTGKLPCADCPGIVLTLTLYPDKTYFLRQVYLERSGVFLDRGKWDSTGDKLILRGSGEGAQYFAIRNANTIEQLDIAGRPIDSKLNFKLRRARTLDRFHDLIDWRGMYSYMGGAATFADCLTARRYSVVPAEQSANLEKAYFLARKDPGQPVLVTFKGELADHPKAEGKGTTEMIVIQSDPRIFPGESCVKPVQGLETLTWGLRELNGKTISFHAEGPYMVFDASTKRVSGSLGCNRLAASYVLDGEKLKFGPLAGTMMTCYASHTTQQPMDVEREFSKALTTVTGYRIDANTLELLANGAVVARLEGAPKP